MVRRIFSIVTVAAVVAAMMVASAFLYPQGSQSFDLGRLRVLLAL
jgi:hypothetical protein